MTRRPLIRRPDIPGCLCALEGPDTFGQYDLLEHPDCPVHAGRPRDTLAPRLEATYTPIALEVLEPQQRAGLERLAGELDATEARIATGREINGDVGISLWDAAGRGLGIATIGITGDPTHDSWLA